MASIEWAIKLRKKHEGNVNAYILLSLRSQSEASTYCMMPTV